MAHNTASTSVAAYKRLDASPVYRRIVTRMRQEPNRSWCIADLAHDLRMERSSVSGRFNELRSFGVLEYAGKRPSEMTGRPANHYKLKSQPTLI